MTRTQRIAELLPGAEGAVFALATALYILLAAPGVGWMDSGELTAAAFTLGGAHPPGHPAHTLLGKLTTFLPVGEIAFRVTLLSAVAMGAALAGVVALARRLSPDRNVALVAGAVAAALAALAPGATINAVRAEVYAPVAALLVWSLVAALTFVKAKADARDGRLLLLAALGCALAAAFHPVIAASAALPMAVALARAAGRRLLRLAPIAVALGALALTSYAYLPARALAPAPALLAWGDASSASGFVDLVTAAAYQGNFSAGGILARAAGAWMLVGEGSGLGLLLAGLIGLGLGAVTGLRGAGTALATAVCLVVGASLQDALNPDLRGYLLPALLVLAAGVTPLVSAAIRMMPAELAAGRERRVVMALLAPVALAGFLAGLGPALDRGDDPLRLWSETVARTAPGPGLYFAGGDHTLFAAQYERLVAGGRPDVVVVAPDLCRDEWFLRHVKRMVPELYVPYVDDGVRGALAERLAVSNLRAGRPVGGDMPAFGRLKSSHARPIHRAFQFLLAPGDAGPQDAARPPPDLDGDIGDRVSHLVGLARADYEVERGRFAVAALAAGVLAALSPEEGEALVRAQPRADRPPLLGFLPRRTRIFLYEPWLGDLFTDDLAWQAGLPDRPLPDDAPDERRIHAVWRALLRGAVEPGSAAILDLGPDAAAATTRLLVDHGSDAAVERHLVALLERWPDAAGQVALYASLRANQGRLEEAEALFRRALELEPDDAETRSRLDAVVAARQQAQGGLAPPR